MKKGVSVWMGNVQLNNKGYTIIELMVVLAVSSVLLVSALALTYQRIQKTQFTVAINEITSRISTYYNNAVDGYYAQGNLNISCTASPSPGNEGDILINGGGPKSRGDHQGCIFMGRALQFQPSPGSNPERVFVYNMVGQQYSHNIPGALSTDLTDAHPRPLSPDTDSVNTTTIPETKEIFNLENGLKTVYMCYQANASGSCNN